MAEYTNVSAQPMHIGGTLWYPTYTGELSEEQLKSPMVKHWVEKQMLKPGKVEVEPEVEQEDAPKPAAPAAGPPPAPAKK